MSGVVGQPDEKHLTTGALVCKKITVDVHSAVVRALAFQYGLNSRTGVDALLGFSLLLILFYVLRGSGADPRGVQGVRTPPPLR